MCVPTRAYFIIRQSSFYGGMAKKMTCAASSWQMLTLLPAAFVTCCPGHLHLAIFEIFRSYQLSNGASNCQISINACSSPQLIVHISLLACCQVSLWRNCLCVPCNAARNCSSPGKCAAVSSPVFPPRPGVARLLVSAQIPAGCCQQMPSLSRQKDGDVWAIPES